MEYVDYRPKRIKAFSKFALANFGQKNNALNPKALKHCFFVVKRSGTGKVL